MGNNNRWLKARKRHQILIAKIQRIAGGSLIAALIVGPLIYFSVVAMPLEMRDDSKQAPSQEIAKDVPPTGEIGIASAPELRISSTPIPLPEEDLREAKILAKSEKKDLKLEPVSAKFEAIVSEPIESAGGNLSPAEEVKFESFFGKQDVQIKKIKIGEDLPRAEPVHDPLLESLAPEVATPQLTSEEANKNRENDILIIEDLILEDGPAKINKKDDAEKTAEKALQKYLRSELKSADFRIFKDTSILDKNKKPYQFVLSTVKQNNGKWYVTYQQYSNALPVFDGDLKLIFTDEKKLLAISDNIKRDLPDESEFVIGKAVVTENVKEIFEWDDSIDKIEFIDKGYFEGKPAYRASTNAHDPLGDWDIFVDGIEGNVESMTSDIRLQDIPSTPQVDYSSTPEPVLAGTGEPQIEILDALFSQILGTIYPQTPSDPITTEPLSSAYTYIDTAQHETDFQGYFENASMEWYSTFLDGPNVTIHDDDATSNMEIVNQTPEAPFIWDENSASLAAINAFYHTNKIHDYFVNNHGYEVGKNVPLTVNSTLVDAYIDGCGAWFNNTEKTIEMGRGGTASCPAELNYALGSDMVYHEYTHFMVEDITHLPNILGAESAAMGEAFADYFAASINNDPMWGDVISPARRRNLENTLNYNNDMLGESHHDGMILSGALWDLRTEIGQEATDQLVFNTLFQDRYHYETFMYGMIIEDDDNDDFSDGTPHLVEIITAFDNHGIGPGIANFNGLPLTPEAWIELFGEEPPEGEEDPIIGALAGDCDSGSGTLTIANGNTCTITGGTYTYTTGSIEGSLVLQSSANVTFTGAVVIYGTGRIYNRGASSLTISGTTYVYGGAYFYSYQQASSSHAAVTVYATGTFQAGSANDGGYITLSDHLYVSGTVRTSYDSLSTYYNSTITSSSGMTVYSTGTVEFDGRGTSSFSGVVDVQGTGGSLTVQNTGTLDVNNNFFVDIGATLTVDSGGNMDTNHLYAGDADGSPLGGAITINGDLDVIFNFYLFDGGVLTTGSAGSVTANYFHIGDYVDGVPMGGHVESSGSIDVASYTYLMENTGGTSEGDFDNNSGGWFQTSRLYMGYSTYDGGDYANYNGGYSDFQNYLFIYDDAYYYNGANYVFNVEGTVANYIRIHDGGYLYNALSSEVYQDYSSGYFIMYDDSVVNNYGTLDINGYLTIDQATAPLTLARRPELNNYGTVQVASYTRLTDYTRFLNGNASYSATLDIEGDLEMYDSTTFENSVAGAYTGNVYVYDDLYMEDNAQFHNYDYVLLDDGGADEGIFEMWGSADFYNQESGTILRSDDTSGTSTGIAELYATSTVTNYGTFDFHELKIGDQGTSAQGGTLTNESGGSMTISTYTTTVSSTATASVYDGKIENKSGAASFYSYGLMTLEGASAVALGEFIQSDNSSYVGSIDVLNNGFLDNNTGAILRIYGNNSSLNGELDLLYDNSVVDNDGSIYVYDTFSMQNDADLDTNGIFSVTAGASMLNTSNFRSNSGNTYFYGGMAMNDTADLDNAPSTNMIIGNSGTEGLLMRAASRVDNAGTVTIYDDLLMSNEVSGATAQYNNTSGSITNITGSTTNKAMVYNSCTITNAGTFDVDSAAASTTDGVLEVFETSTVTNTNAFDASRVLVGNGASLGGTLNNNSGGTLNVTSTTSAIDVYRGVLTNALGATKVDATGDGLIKIYGVSGDFGLFYDYAPSEGRLLIESFGAMYVYNGGDHTASTGTILEDGSSNDGLLNLFSGAVVNCTTCDIGNDTYSAGRVVNYGDFTGTTLNVYEDASGPDTDYELANQSTGFVNFNTINIGSATENGGEVYNLAGDGVAYGTDGDDEGIRGTTYVRANGNLYNGADRDEVLVNSNAEYNYETTPASSLAFYASSRIENSGYFGGAIITTDHATGSPKLFYNYDTGKVDIVQLLISNSGVFNNGGSATHSANVDSSDFLLVMGSGTYNNYGDTTTVELYVGNVTYTGGTLDLEDGGDFDVTSTATDAANIYYQGVVDVKSGHNTFNVLGRVNIASVAGNAGIVVNVGAGKPIFGELYIGERGLVYANMSVELDDSGTNTGDLYISGTTAPDGGKVIIGDVIPTPIFEVDGVTTVAEYGTLENNSYNGGSPYTGFYAHGLTTVAANGTIISDSDSDFKFLDGITSAGTVEMDDDVYTTNNAVSGYSIEQTAGTFTTGLSSNTGTTSGGEVIISGGTFNTYNASSFANVDVTGASTNANFEDSTSPIDCNTDIHGYFDISLDATATVNCSNTNDAVLVHSGSPGGNTQVEGTLILNTNLETETMVVGDGASNAGLVTHDSVIGQVGASTTFVLTVTDKLTINSNGALNVDGKANFMCSTGSGVRGGTYGGRGQYPSGSTPATEYGNIISELVDFGCGGKWYLNDTIVGPGGGMMHIYVGTASGDPMVEPTGSLINGGSISANGGTTGEGAGSGGSINLRIYNEITGSGPISADGGDTFGALPTYEDTAGGGGRIFFNYYDKSIYTGTISALGGQGTGNNNDYAGTGTIYYEWTDKWQNQNDGTLLIDAFNNVVDVNLDSSTNVTDATYPTQNLDIESIQLDRNGAMQFFHAGNTLSTQQCVEADGGVLYITGTNVAYNRDHGPDNQIACIETPDPPATLYINDSITGAQSGDVGTKSDSTPSVPDLTPAVSAIHKDAAPDGTGTVETPTHDVYEYQLIIGSSVNNVWNDTAMTNCNIDSQTFTGDLDYAHNARIGDIIVPSACATNFSSGNTYYWKIRFMEDQDDNYATTTDQFWGLWSETNQFEITDGGTIAVGTCSAGTLAIDLGNTPSGASTEYIELPTYTFDKEKCNITLESTSETGIHVMKNQTLTHTNATDTLPDMLASSSALSENVGFYADGATAGLSTAVDPDNSASYNSGWHQLRTATAPAANTKILTAASAIAAGSFDFWFGADIALDTISGIYSAEATVTLTDNNP